VTRQMYQTSDDLNREQSVAEYLEARWLCKIHKNPEQVYKIDLSIEKHGKITAFAEVKNYPNEFDKYPTQFIGLHKLMAAKNLHDATGLPVLYVARWAGKYTAYTNILEYDYIKWFGNTKPRDITDNEPCVFYNKERFRKI